MCADFRVGNKRRQKGGREHNIPIVAFSYADHPGSPGVPISPIKQTSGIVLYWHVRFAAKLSAAALRSASTHVAFR